MAVFLKNGSRTTRKRYISTDVQDSSYIYRFRMPRGRCAVSALCFFLMFINFVERERASRGRAERKRERQDPKQVLQLSAQSQTQGSNP